MRILVAITGASGAIYTQRLLDRLNPEAHEIHVITSSYGKVVMRDELPNGLQLPEGVPLHAAKSMNVPFASGSNAFDAMVILLYHGHPRSHCPWLQRRCPAPRC